MYTYRIAKKAFIQDLSGEGARLYGGRWNKAGTAVIYTAQSRSLAALEFLVHVNAPQVPNDLYIAEILLPDDSISTVDDASLPQDWNTYPAPSFLSDSTEEWIQKNGSLCLRVPSSVIQQESNILIHPRHPAAADVRITSAEPFIFDRRLFHS